ncbi:MAG: polyamine aminopropyltransferase [Gammaproteobacteria bacterium]|nr:polyamine aminopropyltransferase [Gammaproteobacteria bacterium]
MTLDDRWFTESSEQLGLAFSLKLKGRNKLFDVQSPFQRVEVYQTEGFGNLMVIDGCTMVSTRDNFLYHEMMAHPALFTHPDPKRVVIIGGGDCGTLREVLRHDSVEQAWQIDIDEQVTRAAEQFFPELCASNHDPRARLLFADGIQWIADAEASSIDLIIVDSTDPVGPAEGLFSVPFYRNCHRILRPGGIVIQQSESPLVHLHLLQDIHRIMREAGFDSTQTLLFPQCIYPSGWWSATMAGKQATLNTFREQDALHKRFDTEYYNRDIHQAALAYPEFLRRALAAR